MPFFLLVIGLILLVVSIRGNQDKLITLVKSDFTGEGNFFVWVLAIVILVSLGYWKTIRPVTDAFIVLLLIVIVLAAYKGNKDIISSFISQVKEGTA